MPIDLTKTLVIGISSRALFDLTESNKVFETEGLPAYTRYQYEHADKILDPGTGFPLIKAILALNDKATGRQKAQVVVVSRNNTATSLRIFNSIKNYELPIERAVLSGGDSPAKYLDAFCVDLFLSCNEADVREALSAKFPAALIYQAPINKYDPVEQIRIAFDGDAVVFSDEAERIYQEKGMDAFIAHETQRAKETLPEGPFAKLLRTLHKLQNDPAFEKPPIRTALITARSMPTHERVLRTLQAWNIHLDEAFFMGGVPKMKILEAFHPHIFFDDQKTHCDPASQVVPTGQVPCLESIVTTTQQPVEATPELVVDTIDSDQLEEASKCKSN